MTSTNNFRIAIVGAGLGGLAAAYRLARSGHHVEVFERQPEPSQRGGPIILRPNATRILMSWGLEEAFMAMADKAPAVVMRNYHNGEVLFKAPAEDFSDYPDWTCLRDKIQEVFMKEVRSAGVSLRYGTTVTNYEESSTGVTLTFDDGSKVDADLMVAADGIRSRLRKKMLSDLEVDPQPEVIGTTCYQVKMTLSEVCKDPRLTHFLTDPQDVNAYIGSKNMYAIVIKYDKLDILSGLFHILHVVDPKDHHALWEEGGDINHPREVFKDADSTLIGMLEATEKCDRWKLAEIPDLPRWTSKQGRCILLGDSAHGMAPSAAQGLSMIIEDVGALDYFLTYTETDNAGIPAMMKAWQDFRKPRAEKIKAQSHFNHFNHLTSQKDTPANKELEQNGTPPEKKTDASEIVIDRRSTIPDSEAHFHTPEFAKWGYDYDTISEADKYFKSSKLQKASA